MPSPDSVRATVQTILTRHGARSTQLVQILRETQEALGWLSPDCLADIADATGRTLAEVRGVASFYRFLHLKPVGEYRVLWSDNITDRMLGNRALMMQLCRELGIRPNTTSDDGLVSVALTSCSGMCDQAPAVLINHRWVCTRMDRERVAQMAALIRQRVPVPEWPAEWFVVEDNIRRRDLLLSCTAEPGEALRAALARGALGTLEEVKRAKLRGRGGAGFTTGAKWEACLNAHGQERFVVCNADEGEPGTFKDRVLLTAHADRIVEGMTLAALVTGARRGFIYLRGEYRYLLEHLQDVLARRRADKLLGSTILGRLGFDFDIDIHLGCGAYVCGEESALIESLEGKRGVPRIRPPYPVTHGYMGQPTVVNNVETFVAAAWIVQYGAEGWLRAGTLMSSGTRVHSFSGDVAQPGIYEFPWGVTVEDMLTECGAHNAQAVLVSGASGACLSLVEFGRRLAFEDVPSAGAFMVFDRTRDMFEVARNFAQFFAHESCGFCTPCRVGTRLVVKRMEKIERGRGSRHDIEVLAELDTLMHTATHCGLGGVACNVLHDTISKFRPAFERRLKSLHFEPGFDLDAELAPARAATGRDDDDAHLEQRG